MTRPACWPAPTATAHDHHAKNTNVTSGFGVSLKMRMVVGRRALSAPMPAQKSCQVRCLASEQSGQRGTRWPPWSEVELSADLEQARRQHLARPHEIGAEIR